MWTEVLHPHVPKRAPVHRLVDVVSDVPTRGACLPPGRVVHKPGAVPRRGLHVPLQLFGLHTQREKANRPTGCRAHPATQLPPPCVGTEPAECGQQQQRSRSRRGDWRPPPPRHRPAHDHQLSLAWAHRRKWRLLLWPTTQQPACTPHP